MAARSAGRAGLSLTLLALAIFVLPCGAEGPFLLVSAASSLGEALEGLIPTLGSPGGRAVRLNLGASGSLRAQIEAGAPVDVYISAAPEDMDRLEKGGFLLPGSRRDFLSNGLVLVGDLHRQGGGGDPRALLAASSLVALGNPETVPLGRYSLRALEILGWLDLVKGRTVYGGSARQVLEFVRSGSAPLGIVFRTDALSSAGRGGVIILYAFPSVALKPPPLYCIAALSTSRDPAGARALAGLLSSPEAERRYLGLGFTLP